MKYVGKIEQIHETQDLYKVGFPLDSKGKWFYVKLLKNDFLKASFLKSAKGRTLTVETDNNGMLAKVHIDNVNVLGPAAVKPEPEMWAWSRDA